MVASQILGYIVKVKSQIFGKNLVPRIFYHCQICGLFYIEVELIFSNQMQNKIAMRLPQILMNKNSK